MFKSLLATVCSLILAVSAVFWLQPPAQAVQSGYAVSSYENFLTYGIGVYFAPYNMVVYSKPNETSTPVFSLNWGTNGMPANIYSKASNTFQSIHNTFLAFYPKLSVASMAVIGENGEGWAEVVYDHRHKKSGWVKLRDTEDEQFSDMPVHVGRFQTWLDFMKYNGRAAGIYWLSGVSSYHKSLRMQPDDKSKFLPVQIMKNIKVRHVRGNWLLVEVTDMNRQHPMGWVRWRDKDGRLMIFPNIAGNSTPYVMGSF